MPRTRFTNSDKKSRFGNTTSHLIDGESASVTNNGIQIDSKYQVDSIVGAKDEIAYFATLAPGIPRHGNAHPKIANIWVQRVHSAIIPSKPTSAIVQVTWGFPSSFGSTGNFGNEPSDDSLPSIEVSTTLESATTNMDIDGNPIQVSKIVSDEGSQTSTVETQGGTVEFQQPMIVVRYRRREPQSPGTKAKRFIGTINSGIVFGDPIHTWLCTRIDGVSDDGGNSYNVSYEFQHNVDTWDATVVYIDPETGKSPPDISVGDGLKTGIPIFRPDNKNRSFIVDGFTWESLSLVTA